MARPALPECSCETCACRDDGRCAELLAGAPRVRYRAERRAGRMEVTFELLPPDAEDGSPLCLRWRDAAGRSAEALHVALASGLYRS